MVAAVARDGNRKKQPFAGERLLRSPTRLWIGYVKRAAVSSAPRGPREGRCSGDRV